jgi:hypothetical protein
LSLQALRALPTKDDGGPERAAVVTRPLDTFRSTF